MKQISNKKIYVSPLVVVVKVSSEETLLTNGSGNLPGGGTGHGFNDDAKTFNLWEDEEEYYDEM